MENIELSSLDLKYENYRLKHRAEEMRLLNSIRQRGIEDPLEIIDTGDKKILVNGFKRYRCAKKLNIGIVSVVTIERDEVKAILGLIQISNNKKLNILEQARFIRDLRDTHKMQVSDIAEELSKSTGWVSMRLGLFNDIGGTIEKKLFSGVFPVYVYMYTIRHFMRMKDVKKQDIEDFMEAVSGKKLSTRQIDQLAHGFFGGSQWLRDQIIHGKLHLALEQLKQIPENSEGCTEFERIMLKDLNLIRKYMLRIMSKSHDKRLKTNNFFAQANILSEGIVNSLGVFKKTVKEFYDRT